MLTQLGLKRGATIFDYGCSWGYGSYQFTQAGFGVTSFELSPTRTNYAREKLGILTVDDMDRAEIDLACRFDCFFSAHVLEHVSSPARSLRLYDALVAPQRFICVIYAEWQRGS